MSVYKSLRNKSNILYLQNNRKMRTMCFRLLLRVPKRCKRYFENSIIDHLSSITKCLHMADSVHMTKLSPVEFFVYRQLLFEKGKVTLKSLSSELSFLYDIIKCNEDDEKVDRTKLNKQFNEVMLLISEIIKEVTTTMKRDREKFKRWNENNPTDKSSNEIFKSIIHEIIDI